MLTVDDMRLVNCRIFVCGTELMPYSLRTRQDKQSCKVASVIASMNATLWLNSLAFGSIFGIGLPFEIAIQHLWRCSQELCLNQNKTFLKVPVKNKVFFHLLIFPRISHSIKPSPIELILNVNSCSDVRNNHDWNTGNAIKDMTIHIQVIGK